MESSTIQKTEEKRKFPYIALAIFILLALIALLLLVL